jgi:hypothetical protein
VFVGRLWKSYTGQATGVECDMTNLTGRVKEPVGIQLAEKRVVERNRRRKSLFYGARVEEKM